MKITLLQLYEAYGKANIFGSKAINKKEEYSVWIVPGVLPDEGGIDEVLEERGIQILSRVSEDRAQEKLLEIEGKFSNVGFEVIRDVLSND